MCALARALLSQVCDEDKRNPQPRPHDHSTNHEQYALQQQDAHPATTTACAVPPLPSAPVQGLQQQQHEHRTSAASSSSLLPPLHPAVAQAVPRQGDGTGAGGEAGGAGASQGGGASGGTHNRGGHATTEGGSEGGLSDGESDRMLREQLARLRRSWSQENSQHAWLWGSD